MDTDPLEKLLREADASAGPPPQIPADLPARVFRRAAAQRRRRLATGVAAAILLAIGVMTPFWLRPTPLAQPGVNPATLVAQTAQLQAEADWRSAVARRTIDLEARDARLAALNAVIAQPDPVRQSQRAVEQAAGTLFQQGDRFYHEYHLPQQAADSYREVLRVFPTSTWAGLARERLTEIK
jgi:hypothetical protein